MKQNTLKSISQLMRLHQPVGIFLLLWPTWHALWLLHPRPLHTSVFYLLTAGVILMRSTGCIINDLCDRNIDGAVSRTHTRPLVQKTVSIPCAIILAVIGLCLSAIIALQLPKICWVLAVFGAIITLLYPLSKRWCPCPQLFLSIAFAWPVLITTGALHGNLTHVPWILFIASCLWTFAYDTLYAMADKKDDLKLDIHSSAKWLGAYDCHTVCLSYSLWTLCWLYLAWQTHSIYIALGVCINLVILSVQGMAIQKKSQNAAFKAFLANTWMGGILWLAMCFTFAR